MIHRLLAMNIDGTILQPNGKVHKSVKEAVDYVQQKGVIVTLVTSRNFVFAKKIAKALKLKNMIIAHHGAFIASSVDQAIFVKRIEEHILRDICRFLDSFSAHIRLVHETSSVSNKPVNERGMIGRAIIDTTSFSVYHHQYVENISEYLQDEPIHPTHLEVTFFSNSEATEAKQALKSMFYEVDIYQYGNQCIILPSAVSKLSGLLYTADYWDISLQEMVAIGSGMDDLEIIQAVGLGVAMGNAPNKLKLAADWVTRSNREHGVMYMVREHFRKQQPIEFLKQMNVLKK